PSADRSPRGAQPVRTAAAHGSHRSASSAPAPDIERDETAMRTPRGGAASVASPPRGRFPGYFVQTCNSPHSWATASGSPPVLTAWFGSRPRSHRQTRCGTPVTTASAAAGASTSEPSTTATSGPVVTNQFRPPDETATEHFLDGTIP